MKQHLPRANPIFHDRKLKRTSQKRAITEGYKSNFRCRNAQLITVENVVVFRIFPPNTFEICQ